MERFSIVIDEVCVLCLAAMPGMILLEPGNRILEEAVSSQINAEGKREALDVRLCDFDDVAYRIQVDKDNLDLMKVSFSSYCYSSIEKFGAKAALEKNFGEYVGTPETGYDVTLDINIPGILSRHNRCICY